MINLIPWQEEAARRQLGILRNRGLVINTSSTGLGKTYMTAWGLKELELPAFVVAPKSVLGNWRRILGQAEVEIEGVHNWEALKTGKYPWWNKSANTWNFRRRTAFVVDEVQRGASGATSQGTYMLAMLRAFPIPKILLSATLAATPLSLRGVGFLAGLHQFNDASFYDWCLRMGCIRVRRRTPQGYRSSIELPPFPRNQEVMARIYKSLADIMVRLTPEDAPGFPETEIVSKLFDISDAEARDVNSEYRTLADAIKGRNSDPLSLLMRARRKSEILKIPILKDLVEEAVADGRSVVVFLNFRETMAQLKEALEVPTSEIHGSQSERERAYNHSSFQDNIAHACIVQVQAGGVGLDLHDVHASRPRSSFISPSYSVNDMVQCLGRIHRAGGTKSLQMFVLLAETAEERIHKAIIAKRYALDALTTGELWGTE